ncbi:MAG TPA: AMP-binding protein [Bacillota bacterium]|nr:AMP-binding protein [Bacillota bacterium]
MGIGFNIRKIAQQQPHKKAIIYGKDVLTYGQLYDTICHIQTYLHTCKNGKKRQKVAILIDNEPAFLEVFFATVMLGWIAIPFDPKWSVKEAEHVMNEVKPDLCIRSQSFMERAPYSFPSLSIDQIKEEKINKEQMNRKPFSYEPFYIGFTSGSTGSPKGFIRSHHSWLKSFTVVEQIFHVHQTDTILAPGPLCHSLSLFGAVHALHIGATFCLMHTFRAAYTTQLLTNRKATIMYAVPTMLRAIITHAKRPSKQNVTFISAGAKLSPKRKNELHNLFPNGSIYEYYGASELSFVTFTSGEIGKHFPESVGIPFPSVKITIRNEAGERMPTGKIGKIYVASDFTFSGYINNLEETKKVITPYGATVGDIGFLNEQGVLTIVGRENNMVITGGLNVYPEEIEKVIKEIEEVKEAVVVGIEDEYWGQKLIAFVQWKKPLPIEQLKDYCKKQLSNYKIPKQFYEVDEIPYTSSGKVARKEINQQMVRRLKK